MKKLSSIIVLIFTTLLLHSCAHWAGSFVDKINNFIPEAANKVTVEKSYTARFGHIVVSQNGKYFAIDVQRYSHKYFQWKYGEDGWRNILDYYYNWRHEVEKVGPDRYEGDFYWRRYEANDQTVKDLEKVGYLRQALEWEVTKDFMVENYALSEERAGELAGLYQGWKMIDNKRSLTERDVNALSMETLGLSPDDVEVMYLENDEDLLEKAAKANGITPEHFKQLMELFLK